MVGPLPGGVRRGQAAQGEVACGGDGRPCFETLRRGQSKDAAFLYAFDLIDVAGEDLRLLPIEEGMARLTALIKPLRSSGIALVEHMEGDGPAVFRAACRMGLEGIISKRKGSRYFSGRSDAWRKSKHPNCAAAKREAEEDWGRRGK